MFETSFRSSPYPTPKITLPNHSPLCFHPSAGISGGLAEVPGSFPHLSPWPFGITQWSPAPCWPSLLCSTVPSAHCHTSVLPRHRAEGRHVAGGHSPQKQPCPPSLDAAHVVCWVGNKIPGRYCPPTSQLSLYYIYCSQIHFHFRFYSQPQDAHRRVSSSALNTGISCYFIRHWPPYLASTCSRKTWRPLD